MINGTAKEFQDMANQANKMMMDSWSTWTKQTIQSESFATASGAVMDWSMATHKMMTELQGQFMESLDIPKRSDLARISAQVQSVETRMLEQEDTQEDIKDLLYAIVAKIDNLEKQNAAAAAPAPASAPVASPEASPEKKPAAKKTVASAKKAPTTAKKTSTKKSAKKSRAKKASKE